MSSLGHFDCGASHILRADTESLRHRRRTADPTTDLMNKPPECERPSVSLLACRRAQHATPQPKRSADCPRSRGVYYPEGTATVDGRGSSPLARGLPGQFAWPSLCCRIIPARAGFTRICSSLTRGSRDHPRSRGVYAASVPARARPAGIIPARAGFTAEYGWCDSGFWDHPRSRGVYQFPDSSPQDRRGPSPLARGLRHVEHLLVVDRRIIPARAGFTNQGYGV